MLKANFQRRDYHSSSTRDSSSSEEALNTRRIIWGISASISLLFLILGAFRYSQKKKNNQQTSYPSPAALSPNNVNTQPKTTETEQDFLPHYNNLQGVPINTANIQNPSLPLYHSLPPNVNNDQSQGYFAGGFTPPNNVQLNINQPYPPTDNPPNLYPPMNGQLGTFNNSEALHYPPASQSTLGQRQVEASQTNNIYAQGQTENTQTSTPNNPSNPQSTQKP